MQRHNLRPLPHNLTPVGTRCITVEIPDDDEWENQFYSQVYELAQWMLWERDAGKNGTRVARRWRHALESWRDDICPIEPEPDGEDVEEMSQLRIDCECRTFVKCCDGSEKQLATVDMLNQPGQPGAGTPQPAPGGGSAQVCISVPANGIRLIPIPVSTGDVISIASAQGATNDPGGPGSLLWWCESGNQYFGGVCQPYFNYVGTDPLPLSKHMALIVNINGTFYDLSAGPVTVPSGVSNYQPTLQVNDSSLSDNNGDLQVCVNIVNNQALSWTQVFDFTSSSWSTFWQPEVAGSGYSPALNGVWTPGVGWQSVCSSNGGACFTLIFLIGTFVAHVTDFRMEYHSTGWSPDGDTANSSFYVHNVGGATLAQVIMPANPTPPFEYSTAFDVTSGMQIQIAPASNCPFPGPCETATITKIIISGTGPNPFA